MLLSNGRFRLLLAALVVGLLVVSVSGCGGSSSAAALTKPQFIQQANAVCAEAQSEQAAQQREFGTGGAAGGSEVTMPQILEPVETMIEGLEDLEPPKADKAEVEAIVKAYEEGVSKVESEPSGPGLASAFDKAGQLAEAYGLSGCSI